jgi:hypothetical protein
VELPNLITPPDDPGGESVQGGAQGSVTRTNRTYLFPVGKRVQLAEERGRDAVWIPLCLSFRFSVMLTIFIE